MNSSHPDFIGIEIPEIIHQKLVGLTPPRAHFLYGTKYEKSWQIMKAILSYGLGAAMFVGVLYAYIVGFTLIHDNDYYIGFGVYGSIMVCHLFVQTIFAYANKIRNKKILLKPLKEYPKVGIQISSYKEDPNYLRLCLQSLRDLNYPKDKIKLMLCIDGNKDEDMYMSEIFKEVFVNGQIFRWAHNYHYMPKINTGVQDLRNIVKKNYASCCLQRWNGKREVMLTAFKTFQNVKYYLVTDSDTIFDSNSLITLIKVIESSDKIGAVGGNVAVLNSGDSFITFLSYLRYKMAFNNERAAQSWFGCVSCISGPEGLYRADLVDSIVHLWADQMFLGSDCTFGDDRHLTNRILQLGYQTRYCAVATCDTETPSTYLRWLNQQIRWGKSYYREWLFNSMWFHKHSLWMVYESILSGVFTWLIMATVLWTLYSGNLWAINNLLIIIQVMGIAKGIGAAFIVHDWRMIYMSMYSSLYVTSLLPAKVYSLLTMKKKKWGTSGRNILKSNFEGLIPVTVWGVICGGGIFYTLSVDTRYHDIELDLKKFHFFMISGSIIYVSYWVIFFVGYFTIIKPTLISKQEYEEKHFRCKNANDRGDE